MEYPSLDTAKAGAIRFNTDSSQMEIYDGNQWTGILATSPELQTGGTRGCLRWEEWCITTKIKMLMQYINIDTTGDAIDFGDLTMVDAGATGWSISSRRVDYLWIFL